jgi:hypothetical protein
MSEEVRILDIPLRWYGRITSPSADCTSGAPVELRPSVRTLCVYHKNCAELSQRAKECEASVCDGQVESQSGVTSCKVAHLP